MTHQRIHMKDQVRNNVKDIMQNRPYKEKTFDLSTWVGILTVALLVFGY